MTLEQAIQHCKEVAEWLEDYKQLRKENDELKRLLMLAMDSMQVMSRADGCVSCSQCNYEAPIGEDENCDLIDDPQCAKSECFEWKHHDEVMKLLGGTEPQVHALGKNYVTHWMPLPNSQKGDAE